MPKSPKSPSPAKVALVSLGCPKNLVDLQAIGGALRDAGFDVGVPEAEADAILVNTCAFIESARMEAIDAIEEACSHKHDGGRCRAVVVSGCLPERYREKVFEACPEVDAVLGVDDLEKAPDVLRAVLGGKRGLCQVAPGLSSRVYSSYRPDFLLTAGPYAYLKIGEGCRHACAFCAIPGIRGRLRSRPMPELLDEAKTLLKRGVKEIVLIAQDTSSYGMDFRDGTTLSSLLRELDRLPGEFRLRILYGHPAKITDELLETIAASRHVLPYFDVPLQHADPGVLKAMLRMDTVREVPALAGRIRAKVPGAVLRTTLMVGFPGESAESFKHLLDFVRETRFDHMGAFVYCPEEGTRGADLPGLPPEKTAVSRRDRLMKAQGEVVAEILDGLVGTECTVLLEQPPEASDDGDERPWVGRSERQAPDDIDGVTFVFGAPAKARVGDFVRCRIVDHTEYDLIAEAL